MRPVSAGKLAAKMAMVAPSSATKAKRRAKPLPTREEERQPPVISAPLNWSSASELHLRRRLRIVASSELRHRLVGAKEGRSPHQAGEGLQLGVVNPHRFDIVPPRSGDAVLGALELRL